MKIICYPKKLYYFFHILNERLKIGGISNGN